MLKPIIFAILFLFLSTGVAQTENTSNSITQIDWINDNLNYTQFQKFLSTQKDLPQRPHAQDRLLIKILDKNSLPILGAKVYPLSLQGAPSDSLKSLTNGLVSLFPSKQAPHFPQKALKLLIKVPGYKALQPFVINREMLADPNTPLTIQLNIARATKTNIPLDLALIIDVTGSMENTLIYLQKQIPKLLSLLKESYPKQNIRMALITYRDLNQSYQLESFWFTSDSSEIIRNLNKLQADGGLDEAEALEPALSYAINQLKWNSLAVKNILIFSDASTHFSSDNHKSYAQSLNKTRQMGIQVHTFTTPMAQKVALLQLRSIAAFGQGFFHYLKTNSAELPFKTSIPNQSPSLIEVFSHHVKAQFRQIGIQPQKGKNL